MSIVGVTGADKENTDAWARKLEVSYPYAYDYGFSLAGPFNVSVLPIAILVAPSGTVVYHGPSDGLPEATLRKHLRGAALKPLAEWSGSFSAVKAALQAKEYGMALSAAAKLKDDQEGVSEVRADVLRMVESAVKGLEEAAANKDYLAAHELGHALKESLSGRPEEKRIDAVLAALESEAVVEQISAQLEVRLFVRQTVSDRDSAMVVLEGLTELAEANKGTVAARQADAHIRFVNRVLPQLK